VRATTFEFEKRFWIICAIYFIGFCLSAFDQVPFVVALRHLIVPSITGGGPQAIMFARLESQPVRCLFFSRLDCEPGERHTCELKLFTTPHNIAKRW